MIQIAPAKVAHIAIRAREYDAKVAPWDDSSEEERQDEIEAILEESPHDPIAAELTSFIDDLKK